ncbi:MAG: helix-turn-helix domain-containing protein [Enterococcus lemanii]
MVTLNITLNDEQTKMLQQGFSALISNEMIKMENNIGKEQRYMNKSETCNYLGLSNNTLDQWIGRGLPVIKINGVIRFDRLAVDKWLTETV